jgi:hypothetical protein
LAGQRDAVCHSRAGQWDEWNDIGRPNAWVNTAMRAHVDRIASLSNATERRLDHSLTWPDHRHDRSVVIRVEAEIKNAHARHSRHGRDDAVHDRSRAAFAKIRDTLYECGHSIAPLGPGTLAAVAPI